MRTLKWTLSHAVFVTDIDDEHKEIFAAVAELQAGINEPQADLGRLANYLVSCITGHFAHEERLMRASRYGSLGWNKQLHDAARRRIGQLLSRVEQGDADSSAALVAYLTAWLYDHTRIADRMMAAALRNHERAMYRMTMRTSTRPADSCEWVDVTGARFNPEISG
jgi:hemerythrin-like metal-binding protein